MGPEGGRLREPGEIAEELDLAPAVRLREAVEEQAPEQTREHPHTGRKKPGRQAIQRLLSGEIPPAGTMQWAWGWWSRVCPQLCSTAVMPMRAPRCLGSAAIVVRVSAEALSKRP